MSKDVAFLRFEIPGKLHHLFKEKVYEDFGSYMDANYALSQVITHYLNSEIKLERIKIFKPSGTRVLNHRISRDMKNRLYERFESELGSVKRAKLGMMILLMMYIKGQIKIVDNE